MSTKQTSSHNSTKSPNKLVMPFALATTAAIGSIILGRTLEDHADRVTLKPSIAAEAARGNETDGQPMNSELSLDRDPDAVVVSDGSQDKFDATLAEGPSQQINTGANAVSAAEELRGNPVSRTER